MGIFRKRNYSNLKLIVALCCCGCTFDSPKIVAVSPSDIIPKVARFDPDLTNENFEVSSLKTVAYWPNSVTMQRVTTLLADSIGGTIGLRPDRVASSTVSEYELFVSLDTTDDNWKPSEYTLVVSSKSILITAGDYDGIFAGANTVRQLISHHKYDEADPSANVRIDTGTVSDWPRYEWRGAMLDVVRHFINVSDVKKYINLLSLYKLNVLHLHLTDDQGWRIEIKSWPDLTTVGGSTQVGGGDGGFYTQDQYREIVTYAHNRNVMIVPEIDFPGHINAALASYPELNCDGSAPELFTGTEVGISSLCFSDPDTWPFVKDVIREVASLTPSPYIHIGGDEAHQSDKDDYIDFIGKLEEYVQSLGYTMVGWEEIAAAEISSSTITQFWLSESYLPLAAQAKSNIIFSPSNKAYMDMKYDVDTTPGTIWAGFINMQVAYEWDPNDFLTTVPSGNAIGIEAPLWTESVTSMTEVELMSFPRLLAYAEIAWTEPSERQWNDFRSRLAAQGPILDARGVNYYRSPLIDW